MIQLISSPSFQRIQHQLQSVLNTLDKDILIEKIDASSVPIDDWMKDIHQANLFSSAKVTLIYQAHFFGKSGRTSLGKQQAETTLIEFLNQDHPELHVIFIYEGDIDERLAVVKAIKKHHQWMDLPLPSKDEWIGLLDGWQRDFRVQLSPKASARFILSTYPDIDRAYQELKKLSVYGTTIDETMVIELIKPNLEENVFELTNQLMAENIKQAFKIYRDFTTLQVEPTLLISLLGKHFQLFAKVVHLSGQGKDSYAISQMIKIHEYRVRLMIQGKKRFPLTRIHHILLSLDALDRRIKKGLQDKVEGLSWWLVNFTDPIS
jgi:DNA polymerase III subunit delta